MPLFVLLLAWLTSLACVWSYWSRWPTNGYIVYSGEGKHISKVMARVHVLQNTWCATHCIGHLWHSCWTASASQSHSPWAVYLYVYFCVIFCVLRLCYTQSRSDNNHACNCSDHVFYTCTHSGSPHNGMHLSSLAMVQQAWHTIDLYLYCSSVIKSIMLTCIHCKF